VRLLFRFEYSSYANSFVYLTALKGSKHEIFVAGILKQNKTCTLIKKENQIFLIYKEIQGGAVAKSYVTNGLLIYG
jgi:hypothetical protein